MKRHSLTLRIAGWLGVVTVLLLGAAALVMDHLVDAEMARRFDAGLLARARAVSVLVEIGRDGLNMEELHREPSRLLLGDARALYSVRCGAHVRMDSHPAPQAYPARWQTRSGASPQFADIDTGTPRMRAVWFDFRPDIEAPQGRKTGSASMDGASCSVVLMQSRTQLDDILDAIDIIVLLVPLLALLLVLVLSPLLVRQGLKPLTRLREDMRGIGPQAPGRRLAIGSTPELQPLTARFNEVLERMDQGMARERRFAGALAHETRTRLAELRTLVDVERRHPSGRALREVLGEVSEIGTELEDTVAGLLLLTRLESGIEQVEHRRVELRSLLLHQLQRLQNALDKRRLRVRIDETGDAPDTLLCDATLLEIILGNLLRNAASYAPQDTDVRIRRTGESISIINHAPELGHDEVEQLGQRHWRKRHNDVEEHAGLGLTLAGAAARAIGYTLDFHLDRERCLHARLGWSSAAVVSDPGQTLT